VREFHGHVVCACSCRSHREVQARHRRRMLRPNGKPRLDGSAWACEGTNAARVISFPRGGSQVGPHILYRAHERGRRSHVARADKNG
jgi:hypothetical protein